MNDDQPITQEHALLAIKGHFNESVRVAITVDDETSPIGRHDVLEIVGKLSRINTSQGVGAMTTEERDEIATAYMVGDHLLDLKLHPGSALLQVDGIEFSLAPGVSLSISWLDDE